MEFLVCGHVVRARAVVRDELVHERLTGRLAL